MRGLPDLDAHIVKKSIKVGPRPRSVAFLPDGSRAYVAVNGDNQIAVIDLKTLAVTDRISTGTGPDGMAWAARK